MHVVDVASGVYQREQHHSGDDDNVYNTTILYKMLNVWKIDQDVVAVFQDEHSGNQQAESHQHLVVDDFVVVFGFRFQDEFVDRFLDDELGQIHQQDAEDDQCCKGDTF